MSAASLLSFTHAHTCTLTHMYTHSYMYPHTYTNTYFTPTLSCTPTHPQGTILTNDMSVYCMVMVSSNTVLLGTSTGAILLYVYNGSEFKMKNRLAQLSDSVLCLEK